MILDELLADFDDQVWTPYPSETETYASFVREVTRLPGAGTAASAVIDFSSGREGSPLHLGMAEDGLPGEWRDAGCPGVGSVSRLGTRPAVVPGERWPVLRYRRDFTMVSSECPRRDPAGIGASFRRGVEKPLLYLPLPDDNLYAWLEVLFGFCAGRQVAYFSRYPISRAIYRLAVQRGVRLHLIHLDTIPRRLLDANRFFHMRCLDPEARQEDAAAPDAAQAPISW